MTPKDKQNRQATDWSDKVHAVIAGYNAGKSISLIAQEIGVSLDKTYHKISRLIKSGELQRRGKAPRFLTEAEKEILRNEYATCDTKELAKRLNMEGEHLRTFAGHLGLKRDKAAKRAQLIAVRNNADFVRLEESKEDVSEGKFGAFHRRTLAGGVEYWNAKTSTRTHTVVWSV